MGSQELQRVFWRLAHGLELSPHQLCLPFPGPALLPPAPPAVLVQSNFAKNLLLFFPGGPHAIATCPVGGWTGCWSQGRCAQAN